MKTSPGDLKIETDVSQNLYRPRILRHGLLLRTSPSHGAITLLLLQPRPKTRQSPAWTLLAATKPYAGSGSNVPSTHAADAIDSDLLETQLVMLSTADAAANVQHSIPHKHDTNGLSSTNVPKANNPHTGTPAAIDDGVRVPRGNVLLSLDTTLVGIGICH